VRFFRFVKFLMARKQVWSLKAALVCASFLHKRKNLIFPQKFVNFSNIYKCFRKKIDSFFFPLFTSRIPILPPPPPPAAQETVVELNQTAVSASGLGPILAAHQGNDQQTKGEQLWLQQSYFEGFETRSCGQQKSPRWSKRWMRR